MSIQYTSTKSVAYKNTPAQISVPYATDYTPWVRPADWLTLPTVSTTDQKFVGLLAITNDDSNMVALTCTTSAGTYTIDWGDGTSQTVASNVQVNKLYNYSTISDTTISTLGYKQVIVTITPVSGNLTNININKKYTASGIGTVNAYATKWLDISFGGPFLNQGLFQTDNNTTVNCNWLEQITFQSCASTASMLYAFWGLKKLKKVNLTSSVAPNNLTGMFRACAALEYCDSINCINLNLSYLDSVFQDCSNLKVCGFYNSSEVISLVNTFNACTALITAPLFNTSNVRNTSGMFQGCTSLQQVPTYQFGNLSNVSSMFSACITIKIIPPINTSKVANMSSMFSTCAALETIPLLDTSNVTNMGALFTGCVNLQNVPVLNTSKVTVMNNMFGQCRSLKTIPLLDSANVTNMSFMFTATNNLLTIPPLNTSNVANMSSMFQNVSGIKTIPLFNTSKVTNMSYMFNTCPALETIPLMDTSNVTDFTSMFQSCGALSQVPLFNTANGTTFNSMFTNCTALPKIPLFNTANGTSFNSMFSSCSALNEVPAFVINNNAASLSGMLTNTNNISSIKIPYIPKRNIDVNTNKLSKNALESWFNNLASGNSTASTTNINGNWGVTSAVAKTGNINLTSTTIVMTNTVGVTSGMYVIGNGVSTGVFNHNGFNIETNTQPLEDTPIAFNAFTNATNLSLYTVYYVKNSFQTGFGVSLTPGGAQVNFNNTSTAGTCSYRFTNQVVSVNPNVSITMSSNCTTQTNSVAMSARLLNTTQAVMKNWTVSG